MARDHLDADADVGVRRRAGKGTDGRADGGGDRAARRHEAAGGARVLGDESVVEGPAGLRVRLICWDWMGGDGGSLTCTGLRCRRERKG